VDAGLVEAEPLGEDWGAVGRPARAHGELLDLLSDRGYLPVIACVAGDGHGRIFNVNADQMAVACAAAFGARRLIFLTDVPGVRASDQTVIPVLSLAESERLIASGVATGGMQAKLTAAARALDAGVPEVLIAPGGQAGALGRLLAGERLGTRLLADRALP
jgi:acetylglutamate kinase